MREATWHFYPKMPTDTIRNPTAGEFFSTEAINITSRSLGGTCLS